MEFITYATDGDYKFPPLKGNVEYKDQTVIAIASNTDVAVVTIGFADQNGNFKAYGDGIIIADAVVNHGPGARLMVRFLGIGSNPVVIGLSV